MFSYWKTCVRNICFAGILLVLFPKDSHQGEHEKRLINWLMNGYQGLERPVEDENQPIVVTMGLTLQDLIDVDEKNQIITSNCWLDYSWKDRNLVWNPSDYGNVSNVRIHPKYLWMPDVLMYNSADDSFDSTYQTNVIVYNDGSTSYIPPGMFRSTCKIDITWFPFDKQECIMKFGSWTYDGTKLDLRLKSDSADLASYTPNGEWDLLEMPVHRNVEFYECCPDAPYIDLKYKFVLLRRKLYYLVNLIVPAVLLSLLTLITFSIPPDAGEKISFDMPARRYVELYECCPDAPYIDLKFKFVLLRRKLYYMVNLIIPALLLSLLTLITFAIPPDAGEKISFEMPAYRNVEFYECCPDAPYIDLKFKFVLLRRTLYFLVNLIVPAVLLSLLTIITFTIPPDAGEKISFGVPAKRNVELYTCCPEPYIDIKFKITLRRRMLYFIINLIAPTLLIISMVMLLFLMPVCTGEKILLAVTILLSLTVFLLMVAEQLPSTSDAVPLLAIYFGIVMMLCAASVIFTVWVLSYHHRSSSTHDMPRWVKRGICEWAAWLICMKRPGHDLSRKGILRSGREQETDIELSEKHPKSLLANVMDDDDESGVMMTNHMNGHYTSMKHDSDNHNSIPGNYELRSILRELRTITEHMKESDEADAITEDWKFAAAVVDRYLFVIFAILCIVSSSAILFSAPTIFM